MTEPTPDNKNNETSKKKSRQQGFFFLVAGALLVLGSVQWLATNTGKMNAQDDMIAISEVSEVSDEETVSNSVFSDEDVKNALKDRILGQTTAPIKISEHSSLTCGHCANFHKMTFKALKREFIDTGKAYLVYSDFPLNAPALHASMIARCLPEDKFFDFVQMLFENQEDWGHSRGYLSYLKDKAEIYGLSQEKATACLGSEELQKGILARMEAAKNQWQITSTPSFVLNNKKILKGALPIQAFEEAIGEITASMDEGE